MTQVLHRSNDPSSAVFFIATPFDLFLLEFRLSNFLWDVFRLEALFH
jgi:hypothetical protein